MEGQKPRLSGRLGRQTTQGHYELSGRELCGGDWLQKTRKREKEEQGKGVIGRRTKTLVLGKKLPATACHCQYGGC